jgi:hypothetical protein
LLTGQKKVNVTIDAGMAAAATAGGTSASAPATALQQNDISLYLKGRFLCSMDATWRALGFHTYPASSPSVTTIKIKTPDQVHYLWDDKKSCDLLVYIHRPEALQHYKYTEVFSKYLCGTCVDYV